MNEPKRYLAKCPWYAIETQEHPMGEFVLYSDYARLKAEVERVVGENSHLQGGIYSLSLNVVQLKDEVERLTKENETRRKDMELLFASYKQALEDIRRLHWDLRTPKEGKQS